MMSTPVTRALDALAIPYTLHEHVGPVHSLEQAARERDLQPGQVVRSLVFRTESGSFVMLLIPGQGRASWPKLRLLADNGLLEHEMISIGAGIRNAGVLLRSADLIRALEPELGEFREGSPIS